MNVLPSRRAVWAVFALAMAGAAAAVAGVAPQAVAVTLAGMAFAFMLAMALDLWNSERVWRAAPLQLARRLPSAFALGVRRDVELSLVNEGAQAWNVQLFDGVDPRLGFEGLPLSLRIEPRADTAATYAVLPMRRGRMRFQPVQARVRTRWGLMERVRMLGEAQDVRVHPNFAEVARYAWLAGDRRLAEIGIKTFVRRGAGTDFKQLSEYRHGDDIRHIDWKATLRHGHAIVREYQDERDQCVLFLLDCGRRMRADDADMRAGGSHFDQALNALMLLAYVALADGDEVGAMTYGLEPADTRRFSPRKGAATLGALMSVLHDVEPQPVQSDLQRAAQELMRLHPKRSLVVVLTDFRDEDAAETGPALALLRTRHLVLLASLRERVLRETVEQPLSQRSHAVHVAGAHYFEQARRDAFNKLAERDALMLDVEPHRLAAELVNRYHAIKRSGLL